VKRTAVFVAIMLSMASSLFCQEASLLTNQNRKLFAAYLFENRDYLRAAEEYTFMNAQEQNDTLLYNAGLCYFKMAEFEKANAMLSSLSNQKFQERTRLLQLKIALMQKSSALDSLSHPEFYPTPEINQTYKRLSILNQILNGTIESRATIEQNFNREDVSSLQNFNNSFAHPKKKSPAAAALLSALIPGAGKIYTGNYGDGVTAFLVTGLFAYLTVENVYHGHPFRTWLFGSLAAFFNAGNIYGSFISARNYNVENAHHLENDYDTYLNERDYFVPKEIEEPFK